MPYDVRVTRLEPPQTLIAALFAACRRVPFTGDALASVWDASAVWANRCDEPVEEVRVCRTTITAIPAFSSDLEEALREALGMAAELLPIVDDRGKSWLVLNALRPAEVVERIDARAWLRRGFQLSLLPNAPHDRGVYVDTGFAYTHPLFEFDDGVPSLFELSQRLSLSNIRFDEVGPSASAL